MIHHTMLNISIFIEGVVNIFAPTQSSYRYVMEYHVTNRTFCGVGQFHCLSLFIVCHCLLQHIMMDYEGNEMVQHTNVFELNQLSFMSRSNTYMDECDACQKVIPSKPCQILYRMVCVYAYYHRKFITQGR